MRRRKDIEKIQRRVMRRAMLPGDKLRCFETGDGEVLTIIAARGKSEAALLAMAREGWEVKRIAELALTPAVGGTQ